MFRAHVLETYRGKKFCASSWLITKIKNILVNCSPEFRTRPITDNIGFNHIPTTPSDKNFSVYLK